MADLYIDLRITNNDLTLDSGGEPELLSNRESIAQDIKHLIRESGLMVNIIGQRDPVKVKSNLQQLEIFIEDDERLVPGTIVITPLSANLYTIAANTVDFGLIQLSIGL